MSAGDFLRKHSPKSSKISACAIAIAPERRSLVENVLANASDAARATSPFGSLIAFIHDGIMAVPFNTLANDFPLARAMCPCIIVASRRTPTSPSADNFSYARVHGFNIAITTSCDFTSTRPRASAPSPPSPSSNAAPLSPNNASYSSRSALSLVAVDDLCAHRRNARATSSSPNPSLNASSAASSATPPAYPPNPNLCATSRGRLRSV